MKSILIIVFATIISTKSYAQATDLAIRAVRNAVGHDVDGFRFFSYPTNNFGVGTSCRNKWNVNGYMVCDMIHCLGLDDIAAGTKSWKNVNGYAYYGDGPGVTLTDSVKKTFGFGALLPKILNVLKLSLRMSNSQSSSVSIIIDSAVVRHLDFTKFMKFATDPNSPSALRKAWDARRLIVATSDFAILKYSVEVNPVDSFGFEFASKLDSILKINSNVTLNRDSLGINITKLGNSHYSISSNTPLVLGVYVQKQKRIAPQAAAMTWNDWGDVIPENEIEDPNNRIK